MKLGRTILWHLVFSAALLAATYFWVRRDSTMLDGRLFGISTTSWLVLALAVPIVHQLYVLVIWRLELYGHRISSKYGPKGFYYYKAGFTVLILSRIVTITLLAFSNKNTLPMDPGLAYALAGLLFVPGAYTMYSVKKYFGMDRAFGIDHFKPNEFRNKSFVKGGIFKYTSNGMYIYGFLLLYVPGLLLLSKAALMVALFNHLAIWIHYYFTELPDIKYIYSANNP